MDFEWLGELNGGFAVDITLDRPITLQEWTTIEADVISASGIQIINEDGDLGPENDEPDRVDFAFLPCNLDQDDEVGPFDLLKFRHLVNGVETPHIGTVGDFIDIDRDGETGPWDLLMFRKLIRGIAPATRPWNGETMNNPRP